MKIIEPDLYTSERIISDYDPGSVFRWDNKFWITIDNSRGFVLNISKNVYDIVNSRLAVNLSDGQLFIFNAYQKVQVIPEAELVISGQPEGAQ